MAIEGYKQYRHISKEAQKIDQIQTIIDRATVFNLPFLQNSVLVERLLVDLEETKEDEGLLKELIDVFEGLKESEKKGCMS
jgi:hypothetical protein